MKSIPLAPMDVASRTERLRQLFDSVGCDAMLVTNLHNIRYLTGFTGSAAMLLVLADTLIFSTDGRYELQSQHELSAAGVNAELVIGKGNEQRDGIVDAATNARRIGLEANDVTWARYSAFAESWFGSDRLVATVGHIEKLRAVKDEGEIARIERACNIADDALLLHAPLLASGVTERDFALTLEVEMRKHGVQIAWSPIVAAGPNGAEAHHVPGDYVIQKTDLVVIDFGCEVDGYRSDMTRTLCPSGEPGDFSMQMYQTVLQAQAASLAVMRPGASVAEVDKACRDVIAGVDPGWAETMTHGSGHGVGLDNHEWPILSSAVTDSLVPGQVITIEPGVYLAGHGGVRIEDTVLITNDGNRSLTNLEKTFTLN